jgi:hypothetical protein
MREYIPCLKIPLDNILQKHNYNDSIYEILIYDGFCKHKNKNNSFCLNKNTELNGLCKRHVKKQTENVFKCNYEYYNRRKKKKICQKNVKEKGTLCYIHKRLNKYNEEYINKPIEIKKNCLKIEITEENPKCHDKNAKFLQIYPYTYVLLKEELPKYIIEINYLRKSKSSIVLSIKNDIYEYININRCKNKIKMFIFYLYIKKRYKKSDLKNKNIYFDNKINYLPDIENLQKENIIYKNNEERDNEIMASWGVSSLKEVSDIINEYRTHICQIHSDDIEQDLYNQIYNQIYDETVEDICNRYSFKHIKELDEYIKSLKDNYSDIYNKKIYLEFYLSNIYYVLKTTNSLSFLKKYIFDILNILSYNLSLNINDSYLELIDKDTIPERKVFIEEIPDDTILQNNNENSIHLEIEDIEEYKDSNLKYYNHIINNSQIKSILINISDLYYNPKNMQIIPYKLKFDIYKNLIKKHNIDKYKEKEIFYNNKYKKNNTTFKFFKSGSIKYTWYNNEIKSETHCQGNPFQCDDCDETENINDYIFESIVDFYCKKCAIENVKSFIYFKKKIKLN